MAREEEIRQSAAAYILEMYGEENEDSDVAEGFIAGAKWADKTNVNGKELLYVSQKTAERTKEEFIKKACEWLDNELYEVMTEPNPYYISEVQSKSYNSLEVLINEFKKSNGIMKRKCVFCKHFNCQEMCELKQQKVSPNGTCREHKYHSSLRGCCKAKL